MIFIRLLRFRAMEEKPLPGLWKRSLCPLRLPLGDRNGKKENWERIIVKLESWQNVTINNLPIHFMSLFQMPCSVANKVDKASIDFL